MDEEIKQGLMDIAVQNLQRSITNDETFLPVAFVFDTRVNIIGIPWRDDEEKCALFRELGKFMASKDISQCAIITDTYLRKSASKEEFAYITENWDTEKPGLYPAFLRQEALILNVFDLKDQSNESLWMLEYKNVDGKIIPGEVQKSFGSDFSGVIKDNVCKGFIQGFIKRSCETENDLIPENVDIKMDRFAKEFFQKYPAVVKYLASRHIF